MMSNVDIVQKFLQCYQNHDWQGMHNCLDEAIHFSDFAFNLRGEEVKAMWHWFTIPYKERRTAIELLFDPPFEFSEVTPEQVQARYRVKYPYGPKQKTVDYVIRTNFKLHNDKIVEQVDTFDSISQFEFAQMAFGFPTSLLALTPFFRPIVKKRAAKKLKEFINDFHQYQNLE